MRSTPATSGPADGKEGGTAGPPTLFIRTNPARVAEEHNESRTIQEGGMIGPARV